MPVPLDTHDPEIDLTPGTTKSDIVAFLYENSEYGYKPAEVRDRLDIPHGTATTTLKRLHDLGYLGKTEDGYYHALDNREDLQRYVAGLNQLERLFSHPTRENHGPDERKGFPATVDESELEAEIDDLENEFEE